MPIKQVSFACICHSLTGGRTLDSKMRPRIFFFYFTFAVAVQSSPVANVRAADGTINTDYVYKLGREAVKPKQTSEQLEIHDIFKIEDLIECYKGHGLDAGNLPNIEDISKQEKDTIFNSCNPLFNVPIIALKNTDGLDQHHLARHQDDSTNLQKEKRSLSRSSGRKATGTRKSRVDQVEAYPPSVGGSASRPIEVLVSFDGVDIVSEVLRLQFLFMNTFFSSLSGCIENEEIETSLCLLDSLSSAFSVLSFELGDK